MSQNKIQIEASWVSGEMESTGHPGVHALLNPKNIVIVGASEKPGNWAERVWRNVHRYGFSGNVYPINASREEVWGVRCYPDCASLPEKPDHLVVLVPAVAVPDVLLDAAKAGARSATVMTSGFDELTDSASVDLATRLKKVIEETGLAVSGPNCLGNLNAKAKLVTIPDDRPLLLTPGPVAIISQSGGLATAMKRALQDRGIDVSAIVSSGNEAGLSTADYIQHFASDPDVRVIFSYLEAVSKPEPFLEACRAARACGKAVVVMKLGVSDIGREAAQAHTGALAGSMQAFDAVAGQVGVIRVDNLDSAVEAIELLAHAKLPAGKKLGAITFSGAMRGLMLDIGRGHGLEFADLAPATYEAMGNILGVGSILGNPLDGGFAALTKPTAYVELIETILADSNVDMLLLQEELPRDDGSTRKLKNLADVEAIAAKASKPIAFVSMLSYAMTDYSRELRRSLPHVPFLHEIDKSLKVVRSIMDYATTRPSPTRTAQPAANNPADRHLQSFAKDRIGPVIDEVRSKALLRDYGIAVPREYLCATAEEAATRAAEIGFPVVGKIVSSALPHKSDVGGVIVGLNSAKEVAEAFDRLIAVAEGLPQKPPIDGILVAEQASGSLELVLGASLDPEVGPVIMFGAGGIDIELTRDVALAGCPLDEKQARQLIAKTRISTIMGGYRGRPACDSESVVKALVGLSQLMFDAGGRITSIDVNPFLLSAKGGVALDGLVVLRK
ncbi:acetate--CoA ligase family protein [Rhizobium sp. P32RR-XVIII]|uniref:acetate--CoA ligase family protein n=1 Tax=Rhizobium sp. P32RR-XVIII TaxID=2726738 RepID=UPI001FF01E10|nr:acetate--CoA ligase family protein [Rhizobium sp. P32RR-XVIII]